MDGNHNFRNQQRIDEYEGTCSGMRQIGSLNVRPGHVGAMIELLDQDIITRVFERLKAALVALKVGCLNPLHAKVSGSTH